VTVVEVWSAVAVPEKVSAILLAATGDPASSRPPLRV